MDRLLPAGHLLFPVQHRDAVWPFAAGHVVDSLGAIGIVHHIHWFHQAWPPSPKQNLSQSPGPSAPPHWTTRAQPCTQPSPQAWTSFAHAQEWPQALVTPDTNLGAILDPSPLSLLQHMLSVEVLSVLRPNGPPVTLDSSTTAPASRVLGLHSPSLPLKEYRVFRTPGSQVCGHSPLGPCTLTCSGATPALLVSTWKD